MNLLITGAWGNAKEHIEMLNEQGHTVQFLQYENDELPCQYDWVEGVICNSLFLEHSIEKFTNLKYIQLTSVGFDRVPMDYVKKNQIEIHNAKGVYSVPMAEYVLASVLQIYKNMPCFYSNQKKHEWKKNRNILELFGKKVCIIGCGSVGTECAKRFKAFGCEVIGLARCIRKDENYSEIVEMDQIEAILPNMDIVILALPLTSETKHLIDKEKLEILKNGVVFVNVARGAIVDTHSLIENIDKFGGLVLDVFEEEPLNKKSPLWDAPNAIVTPHNSFMGEGNQERLKDVIMHNLKDKK